MGKGNKKKNISFLSFLQLSFQIFFFKGLQLQLLLLLSSFGSKGPKHGSQKHTNTKLQDFVLLNWIFFAYLTYRKVTNLYSSGSWLYFEVAPATVFLRASGSKGPKYEALATQPWQKQNSKLCEDVGFGSESPQKQGMIRHI